MPAVPKQAMTIAYLDCFSGLSGDMLLGALLDAGLPFEDLQQTLARLPLSGCELHRSRESRHGIQGTRFRVILGDEPQPHRDLAAIRELIRQAGLPPRVTEGSLAVFERLALAEGRIHGVPPERVHFHEVGAADSIIDIVGAVFGLERLGIDRLHVSPLPLGRGFVETAHGRLPLPAPATLALLEGVPVQDAGVAAELVTPTGAALIRVLGASFGPMPPLVVERIGYGVGSRDLPQLPNLLRLLIGKPPSGPETDTVAILETNLDDMPPEGLGFLMERLFDSGALDVLFLPVQMKKNRPGTQVQVICPPGKADDLAELIFAESSTLGIRCRYSLRKLLRREAAELDSPWGKLAAKRVSRPDGSSFLRPEYEACRRVALEHQRPLREIYDWVLSRDRA